MNNSEDVLKELRIERRPGAKKPKRRKWPIFAGLAAAVLAAFIVLAMNRPVAVETMLARDAADPANASVLDASGYIVARRIATVSSKITGKVREVLIEEGQKVVAGQVLATLDPIDAGAQRDLAAAQLGAARSQIGQVQAQLREAEAQANRLGGLVQQQLISRAQYDQAVAQRDTLRAQLGTARRNAGVAGKQLQVAAIGVDNTVVRAPFTGVIVTKAAQPGEMISPISAGGGSIRTGIGTIVDMDSLEVQVDVNEAYIGRVQPGMPVEAVLNAYPDWRIPGAVIAIIPTADRSKATVKVRIALNLRDSRLVPDMGVRVSFLEKNAANAPKPTGVWVPTKAIVLPAGTDEKDAAKAKTGHAFVVVDGKVSDRAVQLAEIRDADRHVTAGIEPGEPVVLDPSKLRDGQRVTVGAAAKK